MKIDDGRRDFLMRMFTASAFTLACPRLALGEVVPEIVPQKVGFINKYYMNLDDYPVLYDDWGSIAFDVIDIESRQQPIIVTRIPKDEQYKFGNRDFTCLLDICPHEGNQMHPFHPVLHLFICTEHSTKFYPDGRNTLEPTNATSSDLTAYETEWDGAKDLYLLMPFVPDDVEDFEKGLSFIKTVAPNPCKDFCAVEFGAEYPGRISIAVFDQNGKAVAKLIDGYFDAGVHRRDADVSHLAPGSYFLTMQTKYKTISRKFIKL